MKIIDIEDVGEKDQSEELIKVKELRKKGFNFIDSKNYSKALKYFEKALRLSEKNNFLVHAADCQLKIGSIYSSYSRIYDIALKRYMKAYEIYNIIDDIKKKSECLVTIGEAYFFMEEFDKAKESLQNALNILEKTDDQKWKGLAMYHLGRVYSKQEKHDEASKYLQLSSNIFKQLGRNDLLFDSLYDLAFSLFELQKFEESLRSFEKALDLSEEYGFYNDPRIKEIMNNILVLKEEYLGK